MIKDQRKSVLETSSQEPSSHENDCEPEQVEENGKKASSGFEDNKLKQQNGSQETDEHKIYF